MLFIYSVAGKNILRRRTHVGEEKLGGIGLPRDCPTQTKAGSLRKRCLTPHVLLSQTTVAIPKALANTEVLRTTD